MDAEAPVDSVPALSESVAERAAPPLAPTVRVTLAGPLPEVAPEIQVAVPGMTTVQGQFLPAWIERVTLPATELTGEG